MVKVGPGFRPVLPCRGWGAAGRQPDALLAPDERLGIFFKILCLAPLLHTCFMWNRTKEIVLSNCGTLGVTAAFLLGWGTGLPFPEMPTNPLLRLQRRLTRQTVAGQCRKERK